MEPLRGRKRILVLVGFLPMIALGTSDCKHLNRAVVVVVAKDLPTSIPKTIADPGKPCPTPAPAAYAVISNKVFVKKTQFAVWIYPGAGDLMIQKKEDGPELPFGIACEKGFCFSTTPPTTSGEFPYMVLIDGQCVIDPTLVVPR